MSFSSGDECVATWIQMCTHGIVVVPSIYRVDTPKKKNRILSDRLAIKELIQHKWLHTMGMLHGDAWLRLGRRERKYQSWFIYWWHMRSILALLYTVVSSFTIRRSMLKVKASSHIHFASLTHTNTLTHAKFSFSLWWIVKCITCVCVCTLCFRYTTFWATANNSTLFKWESFFPFLSLRSFSSPSHSLTYFSVFPHFHRRWNLIHFTEHPYCSSARMKLKQRWLHTSSTEYYPPTTASTHSIFLRLSAIA